LGRDTESLLSAARILSLAIFGKCNSMGTEGSGIGLAFSAFAQGRDEARAARQAGGYDKPSTDALIAQLEAERDKNYDSAVFNNAQYKGACAQRDALIEVVKALSSSHQILQPSGKKFKTGESKTKLRLFFEEAFDKEMRRIGGVFGLNPQARRLD